MAASSGAIAPLGHGPTRPVAAHNRDELIESHLSLVDAIVGCLLQRRRVRGLDRDDLVQEGRIGLISAADSFNPHRGTAFKTHAFTCIKNALRDVLRSRGVVSGESDFGLPLEISFEESHYGTQDETAQVEAHLLVSSLIPHLPANERKAIELHYLNSYTQNQVALAMGISLRHAKRLIASGLSKLRQLAADSQ